MGKNFKDYWTYFYAFSGTANCQFLYICVSLPSFELYNLPNQTEIYLCNIFAFGYNIIN